MQPTLQACSDLIRTVPGLDCEAGADGQPLLRIDRESARARVACHGAHVLDWTPTGVDPVLFLSKHSVFAPGQPIRGGVPICFPWFGPHPNDPDAPAHGYARLNPWRLVHADELEGDAIQLRLVAPTGPDLAGGRWMVRELDAELRLTIGAELTMTLAVRSTATQDVRFEAALHTYFVVDDVRDIEIRGLEACRYLDKMRQGAEQPATGEPIRFHGETDRVYMDADDACTIHDPGLKRTTHIEKAGSRSTVVWHPWIDKAKRMADFGDDEWPGMVCVETGAIGPNAVILPPGGSHELTAKLRVTPGS